MRIPVGPGQVGDVRHALLLADLADDVLRDLGRPLERGALRRVGVNREFGHVLAGNERAPDHPVQRIGQRDQRGRDADNRHRMRERPSERGGVPPIQGAKQPVVLGVAPRRACWTIFSQRELSIGVSVKLTIIETRIANAIVQPNG